jgi:Cu(I)/Ag(I) efflux system periplasmic protein CusF
MKRQGFNMKFSSFVTAASWALSSVAFAQTSSADHAAHHPAGASAAAASKPMAPMADGEVRKLDKEQGKVTLKHGPIASLDMPGMTMVFKVADPKMLDSLKQGDKVKFTADKVNGAMTVTAIEVTK